MMKKSYQKQSKTISAGDIVGRLSKQAYSLTICSRGFENRFNKREIPWRQLTSILAANQYSQSVRDVSVHFSAQRFQPTSLAYFCANMPNLEHVSLNNLDTSQVESMQAMFAGATKLESLDLSHFDTDKVADISHMFEQCQALSDVYCSPDFRLFSPHLSSEEKRTVLMNCNPDVKFHLIQYQRDAFYVPHRVEVKTCSLKDVKKGWNQP